MCRLAFLAVPLLPAAGACNVAPSTWLLARCFTGARQAGPPLLPGE